MENVPIFIAILLLCNCCRSGIADKLIVFDEERRQLSLNYMSDRYGLEKDGPTIVPGMIAFHWTTTPTLNEPFEAFKDPVLPGGRVKTDSKEKH